MEEAGSKYVDYIAVEKLISEKLQHAHHAPSGRQVNDRFDDFAAVPPFPADLRERTHGGEGEQTFISAVDSGYKENDLVRSRIFRAQRSRGAVLFLHGLFEENLLIYKFYFSQLNALGLDVHVMLLPFHYERKPQTSAFSGEFFWSGDIDRSALAYKQAVYDAWRLYNHIKKTADRPVLLNGFSMGGGVALTLATLAELDALFVINPVCNFPDLIWNRRLFSTIKADLERAGISLETIVRRLAHFDPINGSPQQANTAVAFGLYDQVSAQQNYDLLINAWHPHVLPMHAGHLNILRVPRLAQEASDWYARMTS